MFLHLFTNNTENCLFSFQKSKIQWQKKKLSFYTPLVMEKDPFQIFLSPYSPTQKGSIWWLKRICLLLEAGRWKMV